MTNKEAIEVLKFKRECFDFEGFSCKMPYLGTEIGCNTCAEAVDVATEALEKQIPKKPINICNYSKRYRGGKCECGFFLTEHMHTYCPNCSQKVDWSDEE